MHLAMNSRCLCAVLCLTAVGLAPTSSQADTAKGSIVIIQARIRPPPPGAPTAAGYATITNRGGLPDRLLGGSTPAATRVEVHQMTMTGMVMRMRPVAGGLSVGAHQTVRFADDGYHLMLVGPLRRLKPGDRVPVTLIFQRAGAVPATFIVGDR